MYPVHSSILALALLATAGAQVDATYTPYGSGCPGTGTGIGADNVVPAPYATSFGGSDNSIPFTWSPVRYQQVFLGTDLPHAFTTAALSLRQNERAAPVAHGITVELDIQVGYTTRGPSTMNTTFASNFDSGVPMMVLPRSFVVFPDQRPTPPTSPSDFFFTMPWPVPFAWNPAPSLNLLMEVRVYGNSFGNQIWGYPLDAAGGQTARLYGSPPTTATGTLNPGYGLVMNLRELTHTAVPVLDSTETPQIGNQFPVRVSQARASSVAVLFFGMSGQAWGGIPLPLDLGSIGAPGCSLLASGEFLIAANTNAAGTGRVIFDIPNDIYLLRGRFYNQYLVADLLANPLGFSTSNGSVGVFGNQ